MAGLLDGEWMDGWKEDGYLAGLIYELMDG